jgi:serine/threonine-protein kinase
MPDPIRCPTCGHAAAAEDRFCPKCGTVIPGAPTLAAGRGPVAPGTSSQPEPPPRSAEQEAALVERLREALSPAFLLVRRLGTGGMASVWLAREPALRRLVAVKLLAPELAVSPSARARFEREAQAVAGLVHPNVVGIHGLGALADDTPYFVMQHVGGKSLAARLEEEGPLDPDDARRITGEVANALAAAHAKGIIHRDIKPANVLYDDETGRVLVSDFGIAAVRPADDAKGDSRLTQTGMIVGTPQYMSPEQLVGEEATDRTDVYALGLLAYELVAGKGPFPATTPQALMAMHLRDVPPALSTIRPDVDPEFERLVAACLDKEPARRPSAAAIAKQLAPGGGVALEWPPPGLEALHGRLRRVSLLFWLGSILTVGAALTLTLGRPGHTGDGGTTGFLLLALAGALGTVFLVAAVAGLSSALRRASLAVHRGYTWLTVAETIADSRGDTGVLIAGAREYARFDGAARSALRWFRVARETLFCFGGASLPVLLFLAVRLASAGTLGPVAAATLVIGPAALALLAALGLAVAEARAVHELRSVLAHRRRRREDGARLVEPWYASFDSVRGPGGVGRGAAGHDVAGWLSGTVATIVVVLATFALVPLWALGSMAPRIWANAVDKTTTTQAKSQGLSLVRRYDLPRDSSITALEAGRAYYSLVEMGREPGATSGAFRQQRLPRRLPPLPTLDDSSIFPQAGWWRGPDDMKILGLAVHGFNPAQRAWLERLAAHPAWAAFSTFARAPDFDYIGARFVLPFPPRADVLSLPVPSFAGTKVMAYANTVRAALFLSQGRRADAERALRETVAFGIQLVDHGSTILDLLIGVVVAGIGRHALEQYYTAIGSPDGPALRDATTAWQSRYDTLIARRDEEADRLARLSPRQLRARALETPFDRTLPRGLRFEQLRIVSIASCTDLEEIVFGPAPDVQGVFARARRDLARFASDSAVIALMERELYSGPPVSDDDVGPPELRRSWLEHAAFHLARGAGGLFGNARLRNCGPAIVLWGSAHLN